MMKRGARGITLIELVIVMAIIAVMGIFMAPAIGEWVDNYRIKQSARDIASSLNLAKIKAITNCREYRVEFNTDNNTFILSRGNKANGSDDWQQEGSTISVSRNVDIVKDATGFGTSKSTIEFNPDATSTAGSIFIENTKGKRYRVIVLGSTGRIRMKEGWQL